MYNPEFVFLIGSKKSYNYKFKTSKKLTQKSLPTIHLIVYVESTIMYNLGLTI